MPYQFQIQSLYGMKIRGFGAAQHSINAKILNALKKTAFWMEKELRKTHETWENHTVEWTIKMNYVGGDPMITVSTTSGIWALLDEGFERTMEVSRNWESKTEVGVFGSGPGKGYAFRGRNRGPWWVTSREWTEIMISKEGGAADMLVDELSKVVNSVEQELF